MSREIQVTFDAVDPGAQATFWAAALGFELDAPPPGFDTWDAALDAWGVPADQRNRASAIHDPDGNGPRIFFQQVTDTPKTAKNKLHLDVRAAPRVEQGERMDVLEVECARLVALGATRVERHEPTPPTSHGFIVMQDPEGNEFCLD